MRVSTILALAVGLFALSCLMQSAHAQYFLNGYGISPAPTDSDAYPFSSTSLSSDERSETDDDHNWPIIFSGAPGPLQASTAMLVFSLYAAVQLF